MLARFARFALLPLALVVATGCDQSSTHGAGSCGQSGRCDTPDQALALKSLQTLGANVDGSSLRCKECHSLTRANLRNWLDLTKTAKSTCLSDTMAPLDAVNCLRAEPTNPDSAFVARKLGLYAAAAHLPDLQNLFKRAYPAGQNGNTGTTWLRQYTKLKQTVSMPRGNYPKMTQEEFAPVAEWFGKELPELDNLLPEAKPPATCTDDIPSDLVAHINRMKTEGWAAVNRDKGILMFGCDGATDATGCLTSFPQPSEKDFGQGWATPDSTMRLLRDFSFTTSFWTRSSADGRFVAAGGVKVIDLQKNVEIPVEASYDPSFFPDNSGFLFQGTPVGSGFCNYSLLTRTPEKITFKEPECIGGSVGLYQYVGTALNGGDYFVVTSVMDTDNGGHGPTLKDSSATAGEDSAMKFTPMVFNGTLYQIGQPVSTTSPFEGDVALSPSTLLTAGRMTGPDSQQLGYAIRRVNAVKQDAGYQIAAPAAGRICVKGGKANFSYDERFLTTHHYVEKEDWAALGFASADDPAFAPYLTKGAANILVTDLLTKTTTRVTMMKAGQYALYPHFRNDGWLYFLVRDSNTGVEHLVASDFAVRQALR